MSAIIEGVDRGQVTLFPDLSQAALGARVSTQPKPTADGRPQTAGLDRSVTSGDHCFDYMSLRTGGWDTLNDLSLAPYYLCAHSKCGGTSIESLIWPREGRTEEMLWMGFVDRFHNAYQTGGLQHLSAALIRRHVGSAAYDACKSFATIRNPYTRALSQFRYLARRPDLCEFLGLAAPTCFRTYLEAIPHRRHVQWEPQVNFLLDDQGRCLVDRLIRLEQIEEVFSDLKQWLGLPETTTLPMENSNPEGSVSLSEFYGPKERALVLNHYRDDFRVLGYPE